MKPTQHFVVTSSTMRYFSFKVLGWLISFSLDLIS
jgi:hypothetical protein